MTQRKLKCSEMTCDTSKVKIQRHRQKPANGNLIKRKPLNDSDDDL